MKNWRISSLQELEYPPQKPYHFLTAEIKDSVIKNLPKKGKYKYLDGYPFHQVKAYEPLYIYG